MNTDAYKWLAEHFGCDVEEMKEAIKDEKVTSFLLLWPIFEQECFGGFMRKEKIVNFA